MREWFNNGIPGLAGVTQKEKNAPNKQKINIFNYIPGNAGRAIYSFI